MSALVDAIRKKHKTAKSPLRAPGVDELLLDPPATRMRKRDIRLRKHLDEMISLVDLLGTDENPSMYAEEKTSERGGQFDPRGPHGSGEIIGGSEARGTRREMKGVDRDPPIEPPSPEQKRGPGTGEDWHMADDDEMYDPLREHLRQHGMDDDEVEPAIDVARRHVQYDSRRRMNGKDRLPLRGGRFDRARFSRDEDPNGPIRATVDHGLDAQESFEKRCPEIARIGHEPEARDLSRDHRRRHALDAKPGMTQAQKERVFRRFPEMRRLDVA